MKTEELTALGLNEDQVKQVFALNGKDVEAAKAAKDKTILLVTHRTALLTLVDRLIVIDGGKIVADGAKDQVIEALKQGRIGGVGARA